MKLRVFALLFLIGSAMSLTLSDVNFYDNYLMTATVYSWNGILLSSLRSTTLTQRYDSDGNRLYNQISYTHADHGAYYMEQYTDFANPYMFQQIAASNYCKTTGIKTYSTLNLATLTATIRDEFGGITTDLGVTSPLFNILDTFNTF